MQAVDIVVESEVSQSVRVRQLGAIFDCPVEERSRLEWRVEMPIDERPWNVGLIVGPSGSGKSTIASRLFPEAFAAQVAYGAASVVDDFSDALTLEEITGACQSVGFNTVPAWMRPYHVLSNGERFRVDLARRILELPDPVVVDEFTSVVDRQVAQIGSHAVQRFIRKRGRQFVAVTCHYDVVEWLQPDWVYDVPSAQFDWRSLRRRPELECEIAQVDHAAWGLFAPYHYMTAELHRSAACWVLFVDGAPAAFAGVIHKPHPQTKTIKGVSRLVTLPDYQGLGLAFVLVDFLGAFYAAQGFSLHTYPAHPPLIRAFQKSEKWTMTRKPGTFARVNKATTVMKSNGQDRPCATFRYAGAAVDQAVARRFAGSKAGSPRAPR